MVAMIPTGTKTNGIQDLSSLAATAKAIPATKPIIAKLMLRSGTRRKPG